MRGLGKVRIEYILIPYLYTHRSVVDASNQLFDIWSIPYPTLPTVDDLLKHLREPLSREEKIPISRAEWEALLVEDPTVRQYQCYPKDLDLLFAYDEDMVANAIWPFVRVAIISDPPPFDSTEDTFHCFWDENIVKILGACLGNPRWIRNSNTNTSIGAGRPDFALLLRLVCLFRGEEKMSTYDGTHPRDELISKTQWHYDPAPYVLGELFFL